MSFVEATRMEKARSAVAVAGLHLLLAFALITGLGLDLAGGVSETLKAFNVAPPPPPPPAEDEPAPEQREAAPEAEAPAAPPAPTAEPPPIVAPPPVIEQDVPPPVAAGLVPASGAASSAGAADAGSGSGAGGQGTGIGGGGSGSGGGGSRAVLNSGEIVRSDYPRAAVEARAEGRVEVRFTVGTDGRVSGCRVVRSSGSAALDQTTCRLVEARFRWTPARDARGNPIAEERGWQQTWWFDRRQRTTRRRIDPPTGKARAESPRNQVREVVD